MEACGLNVGLALAICAADFLGEPVWAACWGSHPVPSSLDWTPVFLPSLQLRFCGTSQGSRFSKGETGTPSTSHLKKSFPTLSVHQAASETPPSLSHLNMGVCVWSPPLDLGKHFVVPVLGTWLALNYCSSLDFHHSCHAALPICCSVKSQFFSWHLRPSPIW